MTNEQIKKYHEKLNDNISKYGYHSTFVFADKMPSFCYSTGIYKSFGIPENTQKVAQWRAKWPPEHRPELATTGPVATEMVAQ